MKLITHVMVEMEVTEEPYQFSLEKTEKFNHFVGTVVEAVNHYLCDVLKLPGIKFIQGK